MTKNEITALATGTTTRLVREILKGSPEYRVELISTGEELAKAHAVAGRFTVVVNGRWAGITTEDLAVANLKRLVK